MQQLSSQKPTSTPIKKYSVKKSPITLSADDMVSKLLALRNVEDADKAQFLKPDFESGLHDPFLFKDMDRAVDRIMKAMEKREHILVYSDFDADGLPGSAVMHDFFTKISYPHVSYFRPDRHVEGFGLHLHVLDEFMIVGAEPSEVADIDLHAKTKKPATLMITIDCGIADVGPVAAIRQKFPDLDIIITDHHLPAAELPNAFAIINPKRADCNYPEKMLCGSGVIYKVVCALMETMRKANDPRFALFGAGYEKWLLDLVGLATLSDMVPLRGENRLLAYYGLIVMRKTRRPGFLALAKTNSIDLRNLVEDDIVFTFSPRINVASRLADAKIAFDLLTTSSFDEAMSLAKELNSINTKRKTMVAHITKQAYAALNKNRNNIGGAIVIGNPDWKPPVLGLVATAITKAYGKPSFVWGRTEDGAYKGSVRSVEGIDIVKIMHQAPAEVFINRGGHAQSGGFTAHPDFIFDLDTHINQAFDILYGKKDVAAGHTDATINADADAVAGADSDQIIINHEVDAEIPLSEVGAITYDLLAKLAPYGMDNPKPLFAFKNCTIVDKRMFGKEQDHLELICSDESLHMRGGRTVKAIQFFYGNGSADTNGGAGEGDDDGVQTSTDPLGDTSRSYTIIGHIDKNTFRGASDVRIRIVDVW